MAITNADGSIILSTKVDTSGMEQGTKSLKSQVAKLAAEYRKAGMSQSEAFKKAWSEIDRTQKETEKATKSTQTYGEKAKTAFQGVGSALKGLAGYLALAFSVTKITQFSKESASLATQTEASVQRLIDIYGDASKEIGSFIDANARALGMSKASASSFASVYGNLFSVWADQQTNAQLTAHYLNATAVVASKTGRTMEDVQERIRSGLLGNTEAVEDLGIFVNVKTIEMTEAFQRVADGRSWEQLNNSEQSQVRTLAILEQATQKYGDQVSSTTALTRSKFDAAYEDFKNTWGQIVNLILVPALNFLTNIFSVATALINNLMGKTGNITDETEQISGNIGTAVENQEALTDEVKNTEKALKKTLAGFDDLQILTSGSSGGTSGGASIAGGGHVNMDLGELPEVASDAGNFDPMAYATKITEAISEVLPYISIGLVVIGLFLLACGNIPWGIGFIIGGAALYYVTEAKEGEFDFESIKSNLEDFSKIIPELMVAIGVILLFLGQIPWGIAFIIGGVAFEAMESEEFETATIEGKLAILGEAVSLALVTIGVLLLFFGHIPLGIGFIVAGKALLDISEEKLGESNITTDIQDFFKEFDGIIATVSFAVLMIGVILLIAGVWTPLTIGLVAAGAAGLATTESLSEGAITEKIEEFIKENGEAVAGISAALLAIGIILCISGVGIPLGISLIAVGAAGLVTTVVLNWDAISEKITQFFEDNKGLIVGISIAMLVLGILLCVTGVGIPLGIALIAAGATGLVTEVALNWNTIVEKAKEWIFENQELATLISGGLLIIGILLCATGVGIPLGIALIAAGAAGLATANDISTDDIVQWVKDAWEAVKSFWDEHIAPIFTAEWWLELGKTCINGLIGGFEGGINFLIGGVVDAINWIIRQFNKISFTIPDWVPEIGGKKVGVDLKEIEIKPFTIPRLAKGAVIPANREFLAVLGDQKQGVNIETPLDTMIEAFNTALDGRGDTVREEHYYLSETELMSIIYKLVKGGERIQGTSLVNGGGY